MKIIAVEEHFTTKEALVHFHPPSSTSRRDMTREGLDNMEERLREMDEAGIDMQVLSLGPGVEQLDASVGSSVANSVNNELYDVIQKYPQRFAGMATIAPQDPDEAAAELERTVTQLGFKGTMIKSTIKGEYLDDKKYWVIFEVAERLNVPVYLHPAPPPPDMIKPYLAYPALSGAMWGYAADAGLHAMRLICSGVFEIYPRLTIILGHLGEAIPFWLWRIDDKGPGSNLKKQPSQYFKDNFYVTTSGMFWHPALQLVCIALGPERVLFAVDFPAQSSQEGVQFIKSMPISDEDRDKICHVNTEKLLKL